MKVLAIETSCDETACAVVEKRENEKMVRVLSDVVASSEEIHVKIGGIVPEVASREQVKSIIPVVDEALGRAKCEGLSLNAIAVTVGPGLIGSLLVGVETAKALALAWEKPLIPVNHLVGHVYANWIGEGNKNVPQFPVVGLVVSGGHTDLVLMQSHKKLRWLGGTRDDAAGECFDKCSRWLQLGYPGGPAIAAEAAKFKNRDLKIKRYRLPRPLMDDESLDFSFSGLKTAVLRMSKRQEKMSDEERAALADEIQEAITDVLVKKLMKAVEKYRPKSVVLAGGVAANMRLREKLDTEVKSQKPKVRVFIPPVRWCTDNASYIGAYALFHPSPTSIDKVKVDPSSEIVGV